LARILDVLRCAYFLAEDGNFPLAYDVAEKGLVFDYRVTIRTDTPMDYTQASMIPNPLVQPTQEPELHPNPYRTTRPVSRHVDDNTPVPSSKPAYVPEPRLPLSGADDAETTVINMLAPFLKPPTPQPQNPRSHDETSYGMHSATANEVFGMLPPEPSPTAGSFPSKKLEPLPWNWVYTPTPHKPEGSSPSMVKEAFDGPISPGRAPKEFSQLGGNNLDDPFITPERPFTATLNRGPGNGIMGSPRVASAAEEAHRQSLLQSFAGSSAPRTSTFSNWGQNSSMVPKETVPPSWGHPQAFNGHLASSASAFSHPSSLYQGTPAPGAAFGMAPLGLPVSGHYVANQGSSSQENPSSAPRFQMDDTTSSYDAAILQAAFYSNK
jgi:protein SMG7